MSVADVNNIGMNVDMVKMVLFTEEDLIWKYFPQRVNNNYVKKIKDKVMRSMEPRSVKSYIADLFGDKKIDPDSIRDIAGGHTDAIHQVGRSGTHVEFRYPGGANYHKKRKEIENLIGRFAWTLSMGVDPQYRFKEYVRKIIRIFNKIEVGSLKKTLDSYQQLYFMTKDDFEKWINMSFTSSEWNKVQRIMDREVRNIRKRIKDLGVSLSHEEERALGTKISYSVDIKDKIIKQVKR